MDFTTTTDINQQDLLQFDLLSSLELPDFLQQDFLSSSQNALPTPSYSTPLIHPHADELEEFLTPLVSPAITPNYTDIYQFLDPSHEQYFTPLSSPALPPTINEETHDVLSEQLAQIEAKQQLLREQLKHSPVINSNVTSSAYRKSPLAMYAINNNNNKAPPSPLPFNNKKRPSLRQKIALASPQLHSSQHHHIHLPTTPATPASLMKMSHHLPAATPLTPERSMVDSMPSLPPAAIVSEIAPVVKKRKLAPSSPIPSASPRTLKPLLSPFLQSDPRSSNLINPIQSPGLENRRSAHKVAEQRRRDTLKQSFDSLRKEIIDVMVQDSDKPEDVVREEKEKEVKLMSKVLLLQHSYEYIVRLKTDARQKDERMSKMQAEIDKLKAQHS